MLNLIPKKHAQNIVEEMEIIINKNINMMDINGIIIASTNQKRINKVHGGAIKVIKENLSELVIDSDDVYEGSKKGINLPISIDEEIIGVIGITGEREDVINFGKIIKKMTEILIYEFYTKEQSNIRENAKNLFIQDWLLNNKFDDDNFERRGHILGIDIYKPRILTVMHIKYINEKEIDEIKINEDYTKIVKFIKKEISINKDNILLNLGTKVIILFSENLTDAVEPFILKLTEKIRIIYNFNVITGVSNVSNEYTTIFKAFNEAEKALLLAIEHNSPIVLFKSIDLIKSIISEIPKNARTEYVKNIFSKCTKEETKSILELLKVFFKNSSSLSLTASELFIHKNTLQYRLRKITEKTSLDPRITDEAFALYIAMVINKGI